MFPTALVTGFSLWLLPATALAVEDTARSLALDQATVERGYSILMPDGNARLVLRPNALTQPATVRVSLEDIPVEDPPQHVLYNDNGYAVSFDPALPATLAKPIILTAKTTEPSTTVIGILSDPQATSWTLLTTRRSGTGAVRAAVAQPFVAFAVFSQTTSPLEDLGIRSRAASVYDEAGGTFVGTFNGDSVQPIASMTKLITASVFLDTMPNMNKVVTFTKTDERSGARLALRYGETIRRRDAFAAMLLGSANNATALIARSTGLSAEEFVSRMNAKAQALGLKNTRFTEPTGLDPSNVSTANEYAVLASSLLRFAAIQKVLATNAYTFSTVSRKKPHTIRNTNTLLKAGIAATAGKTGYLDEAGYTMVVQTRPDAARSFITVVLGNPSSASRYNDAKIIAQFAADLYKGPS